MSTRRDYYNQRVQSPLTLEKVAAPIRAAYTDIEKRGYLQRSFGYYCKNAGPVHGCIGYDILNEFLIRTTIQFYDDLSKEISKADEITLFTIVEFIHDYIARPPSDGGVYHENCSSPLHFDPKRDQFDVDAGQAEWRDKINGILRFYASGYELSDTGRIVRIPPQGMEHLLVTDSPVDAELNSIAKLKNAVRAFQLGRSTREERKSAVQALAAILEYHRSHVKIHLSSDENDLFSIANNFSIRHHHLKQKDDYSDDWLTWIFYVFLATSHFVIKLASSNEVDATPASTSD